MSIGCRRLLNQLLALNSAFTINLQTLTGMWPTETLCMCYYALVLSCVLNLLPPPHAATDEALLLKILLCSPEPAFSLYALLFSVELGPAPSLQ